MEGTQVGNYRITAKVSQGGMGTVYRGHHALLNKAVAIKVLNPELSHNKQMIERFFNEARATTAIKHPGIVEVIDFGYTATFEAYLVMEFLEGEPLARRVKRKRRFTEAEAAVLVRGMCSALAAAHAMGIVHRDLKPDNIFLVPDEDMPLGVRPKLLDFGIAKLSGSDLADEYGMSKTRTGSVMGTPTYMSPEQCRGAGAVDHRADLYSLGCILYELVAARPPFVAEGAGELIGAHLYVMPDAPSVHGADISPEFEALIMRLLAKRPEDRVPSATDLAHLLTDIAGRAARHEPMLLSPVSGALAAMTPSSPSYQGARSQPPDSGAHQPKPTTLGGVASESVARIEPAGGSTWWRPVLIGGAVASAALAGYLVMTRGGSAATPSTGTNMVPRAARQIEPSITLQPLAPSSAVAPTPTPTPTPELKPEPTPEPKPQVKPESKPESKPTTKPETKPTIKPETKPTTKPETKPETKPDTKPTTKPGDGVDGPIETGID